MRFFNRNGDARAHSFHRHSYLTALAVGLLCAVSQWLQSANAEQDTQADEQQSLSNIRQLIFEGRRSGEGYFSADGSKLIFQSEREPGNPFYQMYVMDLETGNTRRVSTGLGKSTCGWIHPDTVKVLFAASHQDPDANRKQREELEKRATGKGSRYSWSFDENYDIYETDLAGAPLRNLTNMRGYDAEGSWSPDGKRIVFASNRTAYGRVLASKDQQQLTRDPSYFMDLYIMNADGSRVQRLTTTPGYDGGPFFSPDGARIVWRRFAENGATAEVWTMNVDGTDQRQITRLGVMSWAPYYHPSGDYIIFATSVQGHTNFELYIVDAKGRSKPIRVTYTKGFDGLPVFSPDGKKLAWASSRTPDRKPQIFLAEWNDGHARGLLGLPLAAETAVMKGRPSTKHPSEYGATAHFEVDEIRSHVAYLSAEALQGRLTGTRGERLATAYVADVFRSSKLLAEGDDGTYFQEFEFNAGVSLDDGNTLELNEPDGNTDFKIDTDWRPLASSRSGVIQASEIVFAGYGIVAPAADGFTAYDSYRGLDIADKWVLVLRYMPEDISPEHRQHLANYFDLRYKAMLARDKGARGIIVVNGPNAQVKDQLIKLSSDTAAASGSIVAISVTDKLADGLLRHAGKALKSLQDALDRGDAVTGFGIPNIRLGAVLRLRYEKRIGRNVLARLKAADTAGNTVVIVGAHVDHIGRGEGHDSLATEAERGRVHHGADDNASGVAALLQIARYMADLTRRGKLKLKHDIVFAAWSGEELGTLGSNHYLNTLNSRKGVETSLNQRIVAYLNMDMIGRLDRHLFLQGSGSSASWPGAIERQNAAIGLPITMQTETYLPTDATPFYLNGVPILSAFTGAHGDYNTPRDTVDKVNLKGVADIALLMANITHALATRDTIAEYVAVEKPAGSVSRRNLRAYLGTIPDYGQSDLKGVRLNGVAKASPAEQGGLLRGDVIVELAGRKIENIYDFTYALNALKVGQPVKIAVQRGDQTAVLTVTPGSRE